MKLKLSQVTNPIAVTHIINLKQINEKNIQEGKRGFNAKIGYNLSKTFKNVFDEVAAYEKIRISKLEQLGEKDENNKPKKNADGSWVISEENLKIITEEMTALQNQEVEIYCTPISIAEISHIENISLDTFQALPWLFVE